MNPEIKERWVAALRSGEYKQGRTYLRSVQDSGEEEYCCLGVLCEIAHVEGILPKPALQPFEEGHSAAKPGIERFYTYGQGGAYAALPEDAAKWADMEDTLGDYVDIDNTRKSLAHHNDGGKKTFEQIADAIEEQL